MPPVLRILLLQSLSLALLAGAAVGAWAAWLGWDQVRNVGPDGTETGPYAAWQVLGLVATLLGAVAAGAYVRHFVPAVLGPTLGLTLASYADWSDDGSGLYVVGVGLVMMGTFVGSALVTVVVGALRREDGAARQARVPVR
ncbi:hypothetical protein [Streptomyces sp. MAR4 CNX-425]|uniref:hypothetical protein n=1 Tax=Streptomyces sp. MAR4 CNX-425 TaxID=3406343 RepID=UPI003B502CBF